MNALRLKKELRLVRPYLATTFVLMLALLVLGMGISAGLHERLSRGWSQTIEGLLPIVLMAACAIAWQATGTALFSAEFENGTAGQLLAQPLSRRRLWAEKMTALVMGALPLFLLIALFWFLSRIGAGKGQWIGAWRRPPDLLGPTVLLSAGLAAVTVAPALALLNKEFYVPMAGGFLAPPAAWVLAGSAGKLHRVLASDRAPSPDWILSERLGFTVAHLYWVLLLGICGTALLLGRRAFLSLEMASAGSGKAAEPLTRAVQDLASQGTVRGERRSGKRPIPRGLFPVWKELCGLRKFGGFGFLLIGGWTVIQLIAGAFVSPEAPWTIVFQFLPLVAFLSLSYVLLQAIAIEPFSSEFEQGTLSFCLTLPESRLRTWFRKLSAAALWLAVLYVAGIAAAFLVAAAQSDIALFTPTPDTAVSTGDVRQFARFYGALLPYILATGPLVALLTRGRLAQLISAVLPLVLLLAAVLGVELLGAFFGGVRFLPPALSGKDLPRIMEIAMVAALPLSAWRFLRLQV